MGYGPMQMQNNMPGAASNVFQQPMSPPQPLAPLKYDQVSIGGTVFFEPVFVDTDTVTTASVDDKYNLQQETEESPIASNKVDIPAKKDTAVKDGKNQSKGNKRVKGSTASKQYWEGHR
eukprot:478993_1